MSVGPGFEKTDFKYLEEQNGADETGDDQGGGKMVGPFFKRPQDQIPFAEEPAGGRNAHNTEGGQDKAGHGPGHFSEESLQIRNVHLFNPVNHISHGKKEGEGHEGVVENMEDGPGHAELIPHPCSAYHIADLADDDIGQHFFSGFSGPGP